MQDHIQLRFKAKEAMTIASAKESSQKYAEAAEAYALASEFCLTAKNKALANGADASAMKDAEVLIPLRPRGFESFSVCHVLFRFDSHPVK